MCTKYDDFLLCFYNSFIYYRFYLFNYFFYNDQNSLISHNKGAMRYVFVKFLIVFLQFIYLLPILFVQLLSL